MSELTAEQEAIIEEEAQASIEEAFTDPAPAMPEAVAVVFTEMLTGHGDRIHITCRGMSGRAALDELASTIAYARERYNFRMPGVPEHLNVTAPAQTALPNEPQYVPVEQAVMNPLTAPAPQSQGVPVAPAVMPGVKISDIQVTGVSRERKRDGTGDFLRVFGGVYTKFGAPAYDNAFPQGFNIESLQYGVRYNAPQGMANARVQANVDGAGKLSKAKVIQFF